MLALSIGGGVESMMSSEADGTAVDDFSSPLPGEAWSEGGGESMALIGGGGSGCSAEQSTYTAVRLGYARNGQAVTFAHDESWCWDENNPTPCPVEGSYQITWAREFRYDGARARYMNRQLSTDLVADLGTTWSDYDGDEIYGDFTVSGPTATNTNSYQPGLWNRLKAGSNYLTTYLHNDHLGTLRRTSSVNGTAFASRVFTAFGERLPGSATDRFGYVGAFGYQRTSIGTGDPFPYLHVGARYYDPSSGRFLQRDPIGIRGGLNVHAYVANVPSLRIDPEGLDIGTGSFHLPPDWKPTPPKPPSTEEELEQVKKSAVVYSLACAGAALWFPPLALVPIIASLIDELILTPPDEPLNPILGGSYGPAG